MKQEIGVTLANYKRQAPGLPDQIMQDSSEYRGRALLARPSQFLPNPGGHIPVTGPALRGIYRQSYTRDPSY